MTELPKKNHRNQLLSIWLTAVLLFVGLYFTVKRSLINEIRFQAMGVAIATAAGIDPNDIEAIHSPEDISTTSYQRVQKLLSSIARFNLDIRYMYIMRRQSGHKSRPSDYEFVVDQPEVDKNKDGIINDSERSELPGKHYDATMFPELVKAWDEPAADRNIAPDPPYPDLLSGYAPIRNKSGQTIGIVGVDITASTIHRKLLSIKLTILLVGTILCGLLAITIHFYYKQREALNYSKFLSEKLARQNEELTATLKMREELSHMIVHDMRNHLFIITAADDLMMMDKNLTDDRREKLNIIRKKAFQINAFLNDLLIVAKQIGGKLIIDRSSVDLNELASDVVKQNEILAQSKRIKLNLDLPNNSRNMMLDANLFRRLMDNLLSNAIKFSPKNGTVTLQIRHIESAVTSNSSDSSYQIRVSDEGPGVDEKNRKIIFNKFKTVEVQRRNIPQLGLGLTLCKLVAEAHGGRIFVEPNDLSGSIFVVAIPVC